MRSEVKRQRNFTIMVKEGKREGSRQGRRDPNSR